MSNDIYKLAAMYLCFSVESALEARERCEVLKLDSSDKAGLLEAVSSLLSECQEKIKQIKRDELDRPVDEDSFDDLFFKINCLASAKDALENL